MALLCSKFKNFSFPLQLLPLLLQLTEIWEMLNSQGTDLLCIVPKP